MIHTYIQLTLSYLKVSSAAINAGVKMSSGIFFGATSVSARLTLLSGNSGETLKSVNNGQTWTNLTLNTGSRGLFGKVVFPHSEAVVFAVNSGGRIYKSIDSGRKFSPETDIAEGDRFPLWFVNAYSTSQMVVGGNIGNIYLKLPIPSQGKFIKVPKRFNLGPLFGEFSALTCPLFLKIKMLLLAAR